MTKIAVRPPGYPLSASLLLGIATPWAQRTKLYGVLTQTKLQILITVSTSNPVPKIIKNSNVDGNVTLGKPNYMIAVPVYLFA